MDFTQFPITPAAVATIAGAAAICVLVTQWLKTYLADWRFTQLLALGATLVIVEIAAGAFATEVPLGQRIFEGFLVALAGASVATFGYELVANLLGKAGVGPRK